MIERGSYVERSVTHTYTAPSGAVIVVTNVPAEVFVEPSGRETVTYNLDVAEKLDEILKVSSISAVPGKVQSLTYADRPTLPDVDYEFEFSGPAIKFSDANLQTWRLIFDKAYNAFKIALKSLNEKLPPAKYPSVAFVAPSSIMLGIRTDLQTTLFDPGLQASAASDKALRLLMEAAFWLEGRSTLPSEVTSNDAMLEVLLRAVEELSPTDDKIVVSLKRRGDSDSAQFTRKKRETARQRRIEIRLRNSESSRKIEIVGTVSRLDVNGWVTLRDVMRSHLWGKPVAQCKFEADLLPTLLENFGRKVHVSAIQEKAPVGWSTSLDLVDVVRFAESVVKASGPEDQ